MASDWKHKNGKNNLYNVKNKFDIIARFKYIGLREALNKMNMDLFEKRVIVGRKIKKYMEDKSINKSILCEMAGISRPTLNKMLIGEIANRKTFETHLGKIFSILKVEPEEMLGDKSLVFVERLGQFFTRNLTPQNVAEEIGISEDKIISWLNGDSMPSDYELSNLAYYLGTSAKHLTSEFYVALESSRTEYSFKNSEECCSDRFSGYWGHIAIQLTGEEKMRMYPISTATYNHCYKCLQYKKYTCFPTLNNRFVMINQDNIEYVVFLDDACDDYENAEVTADDAPLPQELYTCLSKYFNKEESLSSEMIKEVEGFLEGYGWDEDTFWEKTHPVFIKLKSGYSFSCIPSDYDSIAYDFDLEYNDELEEDLSIIIPDISGGDLFIKKANIALLDAPLQEIEDAMEKLYWEM